MSSITSFEAAPIGAAFNNKMAKEEQKKYKETEKGKETERLYRLRHRDEIREYHKNWVKNNKDKVKANRKRGKLLFKAQGKESVNEKTKTKYGKLNKSYVYHHNTIPYNVDKFIILENNMHLWYHKNINRLLKNKNKFGIYNPSRDDIRNYII